MTDARYLTPNEVAALGEEYRQLVTQLETQTAEQVAFLRRNITSDPKLGHVKTNTLLHVLDHNGFKLAQFRITDKNALEKPQVQATYDIHDELYDYLKQADSELPRALRGFLDGGMLLDPKQNKPTAVERDPNSLTGKTRTGVPEYDALLAARKPN
jgi:hypothetical protein